MNRGHKGIRNTRALAVLADRYPDKLVPMGAYTDIAKELGLSGPRVGDMAFKLGYRCDPSLPSPQERLVLDYLAGCTDDAAKRPRVAAPALGIGREAYVHAKKRLARKGLL